MTCINRHIAIAVIFVACAPAAGCSDPVQAAGTYTVSITNKDNGCELGTWTVGASNAGIPVVITQSGESATAEVGGAAGVVLDFALGSRSYKGNVDGKDLALKLEGTRGQQKGNCAYTLNSEISASLNGDALVGSIKYKAATNGNSDCGTLTACVSTQDFNGTRPP
jgi:hypothetical protein